jgi:hypothetical protein
LGRKSGRGVFEYPELAKQESVEETVGAKSN